MKESVSVISLGVRDFERARSFYVDGLGWTPAQEQGEWACFMLNGGSVALSLYSWDAFAKETGQASDGAGFRGIALAYNVRERRRVGEVLAEAKAAGGTIVRQARDTEWGGYSGYFADVDGHLWEVATGATRLPFAE